jgi:hypothetical protein
MVEKVHNVCFGTKKEEKPMKVEEKNFHTYKTFFFSYLDPSYF